MPPVLEQEIKPDKRKRIMSDTQKRKMSDARDAYWARVKELKKLAPEVERLGGEIEGLGDGKDIKKFEPTLAREHVLRKIFLKKDKILEAKIDAATGMHMIMADGKKTYTKAPDQSAGEYLLNQLIGKPVESLEVKQITKLQVDI